MLDGVGEINLASELFTLTIDEFPALDVSIFVIYYFLVGLDPQFYNSKNTSSIHLNHLDIRVEQSKLRDYEGTML